MVQGPSSRFNRKNLSVIFVLLMLGTGIIATTSSLAKLANATTAPSGAYFDHVVVVMMENHSINNTYGVSVAPNSWSSSSRTCLGNCTYFDSFAGSNGLAEQYTIGNVNGTSLGSYIAITSGYGNTPQACNSYQGGSSQCPLFQVPNIVDSLESAGLSWKAYMEGYPVSSGCYKNDAPAPYYYTFVHNPFLYYSNIANNAARCSHIVNANSDHVSQSACWPSGVPNDDLFINDLNNPSTAANYMWLSPNNIDNAHDCNDVSVANAWLNLMVPEILNSAVFKTERSALFVTFDESGCTYSGCPPPVPQLYSVWASSPANPTTAAGFKSTSPYTTYSPLRTIEQNWGLASLTSNDASAAPMTEFFTTTTPPAPLSTSFTYSPSLPEAGQQVTFTASASGGTTPYSFSWSFGDGSTGSGRSVTHTYSSAGSFTVILIVKDSALPQQTATSQQTVSVTSPPPPLTASFTFSPSSPQAGQQVAFTASTSGGTTPYVYSWSFGDGSSGTGASAAHTYSSAGTFNVALTTRDSGSPQQTANSQQPVTVTITTLTASFSYDPSSPQVGQVVTFTASASGGSSPYAFNWNFGGGSTAVGSSANHAYSFSRGFYAGRIVNEYSVSKAHGRHRQNV